MFSNGNSYKSSHLIELHSEKLNVRQLASDTNTTTKAKMLSHH